MTAVRVTHIGGPTVLIEVGGRRLLTDPTFDTPGRRYGFGWGSSSRKLAGPAVRASELGRIDAVLLTHDQHGDNLDDAGRALLGDVGTVITTASGARRLGGAARGLAAWERTVLGGGTGPPLEVVATPCRHGPPLSRPVVGEVVGFALRWSGRRDGVLWISGDTVLFSGVLDVAERLRVDVALLHVGAVRFGVTGPLRYTMDAREAVALCERLRPRVTIPVHYEGWKHFTEGRAELERALERASPDVRASVRWLTPGHPSDVAPGPDRGRARPEPQPSASSRRGE